MNRLFDEGSMASNIRRRLAWLAAELQIPQDELPRIDRTLTPELIEFCNERRVSLDWLLRGDLRGLLRIQRARLPQG
jgi:hypothetical protein